MSFHIPGEIPDLQSLHLPTMDHSLQTLTRAKVGFITHADLNDLCDLQPRLAGVLWRETLIDAAIFREWMINIGRREAFARACHLLCELLTRMRAVGLAQDYTCELPISQSELGDAMGISHVHANRTLQEIRAAGLISLKGSTLTALDWVASPFPEGSGGKTCSFREGSYDPDRQQDLSFVSDAAQYVRDVLRPLRGRSHGLLRDPGARRGRGGP
jgi:hypothetical protein